MRLWMRRLIDWVRDEFPVRSRSRRSGLTVNVGYTLGGRTHAELPVPWSAEAILVELVIHLPPATRRKSDFALLFPGQGIITPESLQLDENNHHHVLFRMTVPNVTTAGEILWKRHPLIPVVVPILPASGFLAGLSISHTGVTARLGRHAVSAQIFAARKCRGVAASIMLRSPRSLAPLAELGLTVEFLNERTGRSSVVPIALMDKQRFANEVLLSALCPERAIRPGVRVVTWRAGEYVLAEERVEIVARERFERGVRLLETRFAVVDHSGSARVVRLPPAPGTHPRVGPCFVLAGTEPGMVGLCRLALFAVVPGMSDPVKLLEDEFLVGDTPTVFAPGMVESLELARIAAFELRLNDRILGTATLAGAPTASLTAEGGFKPPPEFTWTVAAEDELLERLLRLGGS